MKVLSIRQPWAWLIAHGYKDIENRDWVTHHRGAFLIHASKTMTKDDLQGCYDTLGNLARYEGIIINPPHAATLERGGIVGIAYIVDCVTESDSPWFFGERGFVIKQPQPLPFYPLKGAQKFFDVKLGDLPRALTHDIATYVEKHSS